MLKYIDPILQSYLASLYPNNLQHSTKGTQSILQCNENFCFRGKENKSSTALLKYKECARQYGQF